MARSLSPSVAVVLLVFTASTGAAQSSAPPGTISRPASAGFLGGVSAGSGDAGASTGGVLAFDVTDRLAVEGRGIYMQRGSGAHGLEMTGTMLLTIARSGKAAPYVALGGGLYRADFDLGNDRFLGQMGAEFAAGTRFLPVEGTHGFGMMNSGMSFNGNMWTDTWTGPMFTNTQMPMFYADRIGQMSIPSDSRWGTRTFTDPALTFGGGIRVDLTNRLYLKPDVRALVVFANSDRLVLTNMVVGIGYRF